jgi:hypothetical protein
MQQEEYQVVERIPTVEDYLALREAVGWGRSDEQMTARGLANYTQFGFAVRPSERPGMFRLHEELQPSITSQQGARMDTNE